MTVVTAPVKFQSSETEPDSPPPMKVVNTSELKVNSDTNIRLLSISQGLRNHVLPRSHENINKLQKKRIDQYIRLVDLMGHSKIANRILL